MGFLKALGIVTSEKEVKGRLRVDIEKINHLLSEIEDIRSLLKKIFEEAQKGEAQKVKKDLIDLEYTDKKVLKFIRENHPPSYSEAIKIIDKVHHVLRENHQEFIYYAHYQSSLQELEQEMIRLLKEEMVMRTDEQRILFEFDQLISNQRITEEDIEHFFENNSNFFKAKPHKKLRKKIKELLLTRVVKQNEAPGPQISLKEVGYISNKLREYFLSHYFKTITHLYQGKKVEIIFAIYGSLVTGFASQYSHHPYAPTDSDGTSDVDLGVVIFDKSFLQEIMKGIPNHLKIIKYNGLYFGPIKEEKANLIGPFSKIFEDLRPLKFAGRNDRKVGIVFVDKNFYESSLKNEPNKILFHQVIELG